MIALLFAERCNGCGLCVQACPTGVFDLSESKGSAPLIARAADCQTCFMCELYCQEDALYVDPDCEALVSVDPAKLLASGLVGEFRKLSGWDEFEGDPAFSNEHWQMEHVFARARALADQSMAS